MCIAPSELADGTLVGCRKCWQCTKNKINDYVGRCIAEQLQSVATFAVTLTYVGDTANSATLVYDDFQKFMKRLRKAGYKVRYVVAGEYGSRNGRAHWHAVLFFQNKAPKVVDTPAQIETDEICIEYRQQWPYWSNETEGRGFVYFQDADHNGFEYIMKYALKDVTQTVSVTHKGQSTVPLLGYQYFMDRADQYVEQGLDPQSFTYTFPHVFDKRNRQRKYLLQGRARELFIDRFLEGYEAKHGEEYPHIDIEIIAKVLDKRARDEMDAEMTDAEFVQRKEYEAREKAVNRLRCPDPEEQAEQAQEQKAQAKAMINQAEQEQRDEEWRRNTLVITGRWRDFPAQIIQTPQDEYIVTIGGQTWREENAEIQESLVGEIQQWREETLQDVYRRDQFEQQYQDELVRLERDGPIQRPRKWQDDHQPQ